jgi:hypothetical protein
MRGRAILICVVMLGCAHEPAQSEEQQRTTVPCIRGQSTAATYWVAPTGVDTAPGTEAQPWRTLAASVNKLVSGDTLCVGGGTYPEKNIAMTVSGTAAAPITIRRVQGEQPLVDGAFSAYQAINNLKWHVYDGAKNIYESDDTYTSAEFAGFIGGEIEASGKTFKLVGYLDRSNAGTFCGHGYEYLASDYHDYDRCMPRYVGPGIAYGDASGLGGHIYIRLVAPTANSLVLSTPYPSWYTDYTSRFFNSTTFDPRLYKVSIFGVGNGISANASYVVVDGLNISHHQYGAIHTAGAANYWTYQNLTFVPGLYGLRLNLGTHDILIDHVTFEGRLPMWLGESDMKGAELVAGPAQVAGITTENNVYGLTVQSSTFNHVFDGILLPGTGEHDHKILSNRADDVRDDFVQLGSTSYNIEIAYNLIKGAGPSHHGNGDPAQATAGTKYIHHNIIDASMSTLWVRNDPKGFYAMDTSSRYWQSPNPISSHGGGGCTGGDPWRIYQNTFISGNKIYSGFEGVHLFSTGGVNNSTGVKHEVYNNIFHEIVNNTYFPDARVHFTRSWRLRPEAWEIYDGNLYSRAAGATSAFFVDTLNNYRMTPLTNYNSLSAFKSSMNDFSDTQVNYTPGWENSGIAADPQLIDIANENYRPASGSPALTGAVDLSNKTTWPGASAVGWRGALPGITAPTDHLVGYWALDEGTGTTARDLSGAAHDGTLVNGPTWTAGAVGTHALDFDDINDFVSVPNHADFNMGADTNFSITAWFRVDAPGNMGNIVMKGSAGTGGKRYQIKVYTTGKLMIEVDDNITERTTTSVNAVDNGAWHFLAATFNRDGNMILYVDGSANPTSTNIAPAGSFDDVAQPLVIGGVTQYFNGAIDEVRIYRDRILTPSEIDGLRAERP